MTPTSESDRSAGLLPRRDLLCRAGAGFGVLGLAGLLQSEGLLGRTALAGTGLGRRALTPLAPQQGHFPRLYLSIARSNLAGLPNTPGISISPV